MNMSEWPTWGEGRGQRGTVTMSVVLYDTKSQKMLIISLGVQ